ncbi:MAG: cellulose biosynthesis protein BcsQ [Mariprofundus sp.]
MTQVKANLKLAVVSYKGGVGKTTVSANLAAYCALLGADVAAIDMDDQNGLCLHFGLNPLLNSGFAAHIQPQLWSQEAINHISGVALFKHGNQSTVMREQFKTLLRRYPDLLKAWLLRDYNQKDLIIIDTPPGGTIYTKQSIVAADYLLVVLNADAASFATVGAIESLIEGVNPMLLADDRVTFLVSNFDERRVVDVSVLARLRQMRGSRVAPQIIHYDAALMEAAAQQKLLKDYDVESRANADFEKLAEWLLTERLMPAGLKSNER